MLDPDFLEPERLRAFVTVAETGNFTRAAERLRLTQPAVSTQVRRLEESVGRPLFQRRSPSARLTKDGEAMLGYARELLAVAGRARHHFAQPPLAGSVRFGVVDDFNTTALPEMLGRLRRTHARFELTVCTGASAKLSEELQAGSFDLVLSKRIAGTNRGEYLSRQQLVWVGPPSTLEAEGDVVPLALNPPGSVSREIVLQSLQEAGRRWSIRFESASTAGLRAAVLSGMGIAAFQVGMIPPGLTLLPSAGLPPLADAEFVLLQNPRSRDPVVADFASILRNAAPLIIERLAEEQAGMLPDQL